MDDNIPSLDDLLNSIRGEGDKKSSSALAVAPKKPDDLVEEEINSQILSILGLEDVFDLTYEEYATLLKEAAVKGRMSGSQMTTESTELVTDELKRVRGKEGRFRVKKKKIDINKVMNRRAPSPQRPSAQALLPAPEEQQEDTQKIQKFLTGDLPNRLDNVSKSLDSVSIVLREQLGVEKKVAEEERKLESKTEKKKREGKLEKKEKKQAKEGVNKLKKPALGFFDSIKKYFGNILAGSVILSIVNWFKDPANQKAINSFSNFITEHAPLILGGILAIALLPVASTLISFTAGIVGAATAIIGAIPFLGVAIGALLGMGMAVLAGFLLPKLGGANAQEKRTLKILKEKFGGDKQKMIAELKKEKQNLNILQKVQGVGSEIDEQIHFLETGRTKAYGKKGEDEIIERALEGKLIDESQAEFLRKVRDIDASPGGKEQFMKDLGIPSFEEVKQMVDKASSSFAQPQNSIVPTEASQSLASAASSLRGMSSSEAPDGGRNGCVWAVNKVFAKAGIKTPWGTSNYVPDAEAAMIKDGYKSINPGAQQPGDLYIAPGQKHVGIVLENGNIISNSSSKAAFSWEASPEAYANHYGGQGKYYRMPGKPGGRTVEIPRQQPPVPSIPSPTGRSNIAFLPIGGGSNQQVTSGSSASQATVPSFSAQDPNNVTFMTVKSIYNIIG